MPKFKITKKSNSIKKNIDFENIVFGKHFADYMFMAEYKDGNWDDFQILPYQPISIMPAAGALHYGQAAFEGLKAYKTIDNKINIFRPKENIKRMRRSAERVCMPAFPPDIFLTALDQLIAINHEWIPSFDSGSLYIRPVMFANGEVLGIKPANEYLFIIFCSPVNNYYNKSLNVKITTKYGRAVENGTGYVKVAGNYAASLYPAKKAQEKSFDQLIWTDSKTHKYIEESGTMNIMFIKNNTLITPELKTTILSGITRKSVIALAKENNIKVEEREISVSEIIEGIVSNEVTEAFGVGTAASIAFIDSINYNKKTYKLPNHNIRKKGTLFKTLLNNIKSGKSEDKNQWNFYVNLKEHEEHVA